MGVRSGAVSVIYLAFGDDPNMFLPQVRKNWRVTLEDDPADDPFMIWICGGRLPTSPHMPCGDPYSMFNSRPWRGLGEWPAQLQGYGYVFTLFLSLTSSGNRT